MDRATAALILLLAVAGAVAAQEGIQPAAPQQPGAPADVENQLIGAPQTDSGTAALTPLDWAATFRMVASLAAVVALVAAAVWALKRFAPKTIRMYSSENLRVVSRTHLGPKQTLAIVKAPGRILIVGATQEAISLLAEITDPAEMERVLGEAEAGSQKSVSATFRELLTGVTSPRGKNRATDDLAKAVDGLSDRFANLTKKLNQR